MAKEDNPQIPTKQFFFYSSIISNQLNSVFDRSLMAGVEPKYPLITGKVDTLNLIVRDKENCTI